MIPVYMRWLIRADMPEVLWIEQQSFARPWSEEVFTSHLRRRDTIGMVGERDGRVLGFMLYQLHDDSLTLINLATRPDCRRKGVGRQLVNRLTSRLAMGKRTSIDALVREANLPAQLFLRACGWKATNVVRDCFDDSDETGYRFEYQLKVGAMAGKGA